MNASDDPRIERVDRPSLGRLLSPAAVLTVVLVLLAAYVRFENLTEIGIQRGDPITYWQAGVEWSKGHFTYFDITGTGRPVYRPVSFLFYALAMWLFGVTDYSIKLLHAGVDTCNVLLILFVGWRLTRHYSLALLPAVFYAFHPRVLFFARGEYVHTHSTFFVLSAFALLLVAMEAKKPAGWVWPAYVLSGFLVGAAAHTHEELGFLLVPFCCCIVLAYAAAHRSRRALVGALLLFAVGAAAQYALWAAIYEPEVVVEKLTGKVQREQNVAGGAPSMLTNVLRTPFVMSQLHVYLLGRGWPAALMHGAAALTLLAAVLSVLPFFRHIDRGERPPPRAYYPFLLIYLQAALVAAWKPAMGLAHARLLLPVLPFYLIGLCFWLFLFWGLPWRRLGAVVTAVLYWHYEFVGAHWRQMGFVLAVAAGGLAVAFSGPVLPGNDYLEEANPARELYDLVKDRVTRTDRILLTPHVYFALDRLLTSEPYLGDRAVYLYFQPFDRRSFEHLIEREHIRYVFVSAEGPALDRRYEERTRRGTYYGFQRTHWLTPSEGAEPYTIEREYAFLKAYFDMRRAKVIYNGLLGRVWELQRVDVNFLDHFDYAHVAPWVAQGQASPLDVSVNGRTYSSLRTFPGQEMRFRGYTVKPGSDLYVTPYLPERFRKAVKDPRFTVELVLDDGTVHTLIDRAPVGYDGERGDPIERVRASLEAYAGQTVEFVFRYTYSLGNPICHGLWIDPKILVWGPGAGDPLEPSGES